MTRMLCEHYLGAKPFLYGRDLLKRMQIKDHYVDEYKVMDFLGYEVQPVHPSQYPEFAHKIGEIFDDTCAILIPKENKVFLSTSISPKRQRSTLFHEAGHEILPFHEQNAFSVQGKDIDPTTHKLMEKEAFLAGTEIMYPVKHFVDDMISLATSFDAINQLAERYNGSLEATCIRYAMTSLNPVAVVVVKENEFYNKPIPPQQGNVNQRFLFDVKRFVKTGPISTAPLRVQYCTQSYLFPKFIKSGIEIESGNMIYDCWKHNQFMQGEIPASVFGSSAKFKYFAECLPYFDRVFVLLWLANRQTEFLKGVVL